MPNFIKILFGSCLGTLLALGVLFFLFFSVIAGLANADKEEPEIKANSLLELDLTTVPELTGNQPMDQFSFELDSDGALGLHDIVRAIEKAEKDDDIKGIYLNSMTQAGGFTKLRAIREALASFRAAGKFVVSYAPAYEQNAYYLASAGDEVYVGPLGVVDFRGLGAEIPFYKNMLDKIGVRFEVFYAGNFKSATEPYRLTEISDSNRLQTREYLTGLWNMMSEDIAATRNLEPATVRGFANQLTGWRGEEAVEAGLIDGVFRRNEVDARLRERLGLQKHEKIERVSIDDYFDARLKKLKGKDDEVAVLFAEGTIIDGKAEPGGIGDKNYVKVIDKLAEDDDVKAVVLRVNSGGGSASSSENIWYAFEKLKDTGKPLVVSMGSVAASGGYYIAAGADSIFAEPSTITGSIGVFTMFPMVDELMNDKLGINFDTVNTAQYSNAFSPFRPLQEGAKEVLTDRTKMIYETFLDRVAEGRPGMNKEQVRRAAGGRVYTGVRALEIGLVDRLGDLDDAIASAATLAGLDQDDISVGQYPKVKSPIEQLIETYLGEDALPPSVGASVVRKQLGEQNYQHFELLRDMSQMNKAQCRLPVVINF
ncbi:signal peptide peptidase SppA [Lewinella sp. 4G2]|uniref:signal peptide peptidase SppA n=1 Tax=Lewinella sp. 4G2 TaxID=1803372 RepID=UPI0007B46542|nr:signal peptide peptidase SppA [Lewinella sp. 4G2]OAV44272.1 signal peptide peptidase SppA [Lewinella sp. 4G2]